MIKQIQTLISGIIMFMLFIVAALWASFAVGGFEAELIFMDTQDKSAEINGIRNRPSAGSQTWTSLQSVSV